MDIEELQKLRQYYHSFLGLQRIFNDVSDRNIEQRAILPLEFEFINLTNDFPQLIPSYDRQSNVSHTTRDGTTYYNLTSIKSLIALIVSRLQVSIEQTNDIPITEKRHFAFINNSDLRIIVERDYSEIQKAYISQCWKSVIILCGGSIEAILTDLLLANETSAKSAKSSPNTTEITRWDLSNLIDVSVELKLVSEGIEKLSHSIREYRNLVHPGNELRSRLKFDAEEAKIALEVLNIVHRDLSA